MDLHDTVYEQENLETHLQARIHLELDHDDVEVNIGLNKIIIITPLYTYGFFDTCDPKYPYVAIKLPTETNVYTDPGKFVGEIEEVAQGYLIEQGIGDIAPTDKFNLIGLREGILLVENPREKQGYMIENGGQTSSFDFEPSTSASEESIPSDTPTTPGVYTPPDVYIEEIVEPD